ncbi:MAG: hypothetical protein ACPGSC_11790, partial [Granulosicoccaceae bacterium]
MNVQERAPLRVGIGGPVGSGKTALLEVLCKTMVLSLLSRNSTQIQSTIAFCPVILNTLASEVIP